MKKLSKPTRAVALVLLLCFAVQVCSCDRTIMQLDAPKNLHVEAQVLKWDEVEHATGYIVFAQDTEYQIAQPSYDLSAMLPGSYRIDVMATGNGKDYVDSRWSSFYYKVKDTADSGDDDDDDDNNGGTDDEKGDKQESGKDFAYTLLPYGAGYEISKGNADLDGVLELPDVHNGLPVTRIADSAFCPARYDAVNVVTTAIKLPAYLESIGYCAFERLSKIEEIVIPDTVTEIGYSAFSHCGALKHVTLPKNLKVIPYSCFSGCMLEEIDLPEGLEEIGQNAFSSGSPLIFSPYPQGIQEVTIPASVKRIGASAFAGCNGLRKIVFDGDLEWLGTDAFDSTAWYDVQPDGPVVFGDVLYRYRGTDERFTIPAGIGKIAGGAFACDIGSVSAEKHSLKEIVIPDGVKLIGNEIFLYDEELTSVRLPEDLKEIPDKTFNMCGKLQEIELPQSVESIGELAFHGCIALEEITLPSGLKTLGRTAFGGSGLKRIVLPAGLEEIGDAAFSLCPYLKEVRLPAQLKVIGYRAFSTCISLTEIDIPASVTTIEDFAFVQCDSLVNVTFHEGLKSIGDYAFAKSGLTELIIPASLTSISKYAFEECLLERVFYCGTEQLLQQLAQTNGLHTIGTRLEPFNYVICYCYSEAAPDTEGDYWRYEDGVPTPW